MAQQEDAVMHSNETEPTGNSEKAVTAEGTSQAPETGREEATSHAELMVTIEGLQAELDGYKERYLRLGAEMENIRRRATKDLESAHKFGLEKIAGELLPVRDSLELGLKAAEGDQVEIAKVAEGMALTLRLLAGLMEKFAIREINPLNEKFNPEQHQAMAMQPADGVEPNTVVAVYQKGYLLNERLLRPAMVVVAKGSANSDSGVKVDELA